VNRQCLHIYMYFLWISSNVLLHPYHESKLLQNIMPVPVPVQRSNQIQNMSYMRSSPVVTASGCACQSFNSPGFDPPTQWNLRGGRWSSVEWRTQKIWKDGFGLVTGLNLSIIPDPQRGNYGTILIMLVNISTSIDDRIRSVLGLLPHPYPHLFE
jgi:hypothetical protein